MSDFLRLVSVASILLATFRQAEACSCRLDSADEETQIKRELEEARVVFVAQLLSVKQMSVSGASKYVTEDAEFVVSEVLKGDEYCLARSEAMTYNKRMESARCARPTRKSEAFLIAAHRWH